MPLARAPSRSEQLDNCRVPPGRCESGVSCQKRGIQRFGQGDVCGIVGGEIGAKLPDTRQQQGVGMPQDLGVGQVCNDLPPPIRIDLAGQPAAPDDLGDLDVQKLWRVSRLGRIEHSFVETLTLRPSEKKLDYR